MKFCHNCGENLASHRGSKFCSNCGTALILSESNRITDSNKPPQPSKVNYDSYGIIFTNTVAIADNFGIEQAEVVNILGDYIEKLISVSHEYIICYVKSIEIYNQYKVTWREKKQGLNDIYKTYNQLKREYKDSVKTIEIKLKEWFKSLPGTHPAKNHKHYSCVD